MTFDRLERLSDEIKMTFQPEFIFLIFPDKIQHFPAREWEIKQFQESLEAHLGKNYQLSMWKHMVVAYSDQSEVLIVLPKFHDLTELSHKNNSNS